MITIGEINLLIGETTEYDKKQMLEERKPKSWLKSVSASRRNSKTEKSSNLLIICPIGLQCTTSECSRLRTTPRICIIRL